ncbi:MAG: hypothetical protein QXH44_10080, partial [Pyrobaculum sp.]
FWSKSIGYLHDSRQLIIHDHKHRCFIVPFESHLIQLAMYVKYFAAVYGGAVSGAVVYIAKRGPPRAQAFEYALDQLSPYYDKAREVLRCISPLFPRYAHALSL